MSRGVKLNHYNCLETVIDNQTFTTSPSYSTAYDGREWRRGILTFQWSGYDATDGKVFVQISTTNTTDDTKWEDYGEAAEGELNAATGFCIFDWSVMPPCFFRFCIDLGSGTTITATAQHILGH